MCFFPFCVRNLLRIVVTTKNEAILIQNVALKRLGLGLRKMPFLMNLRLVTNLDVYA
jgi:hypothetical protein